MKSFIVDEDSELLKDPSGQPIGGVHVKARTVNEALGALVQEAKNRNRPLESDVVGKMSIRCKRHPLEDVSAYAQLVEDNGRIVIVPGESKDAPKR